MFELESRAISESEFGYLPADAVHPYPQGNPEWIRAVLAISFGAVIGANARYLLGREIGAHWQHGFPLGTFLINVSGSLLLGFFLTVTERRVIARPEMRLFVATGLLGSYTTFSTFSYEAATLIRTHDYLTASAYLVGSVVVGLAAAAIGRWIALSATQIPR